MRLVLRLLAGGGKKDPSVINRCLPRALFFLLTVFQASVSSSTLPNGAEFPSWEKPLHFTHTYYVIGQAANADDNGPSTKPRPFRTIAARLRFSSRASVW